MFSNTHYAVFPLWTKPICWEQFHCANIGCSSPRGQVIVSGKKASFHKHTTVYMLNTATCFLWNQILPKNTSILAIQDNLSINELHCVWMIICLCPRGRLVACPAVPHPSPHDSWDMLQSLSPSMLTWKRLRKWMELKNSPLYDKFLNS